MNADRSPETKAPSDATANDIAIVAARLEALTDCGVLAALSGCVDGLEMVRLEPVELIDRAAVFEAHLDPLTTTRACEFRLALQVTDAFLKLLRASGARDRDINILIAALGHDTGSIDGSAPSTLARAGEARL